MRAIGIIPARFASTRFPGKPLAMIAGKTMIRRVAERALQATSLQEVLVATDDSRIAEECEKYAIPFCYTSSDHASGTDRIWEALCLHTSNQPHSFQVVVNIQGDEPLIEPLLIDNLVNSLAERKNAGVATGVSSLLSQEELLSPSVVKVVLNNKSEAMYFSRSVVPSFRDYTPEKALQIYNYVRHIGIYAYRTWALEKFAELPAHPLETLESLEQLRLLADGVIYTCVAIEHSAPAVDIPADIALVERYLQG